MSIATEITALTTDRNDIRTALVNKGVSAASTHGFDDFAGDIDDIPAGATSSIVVTAPTGSTVNCATPGGIVMTTTEVSGTWTFSNLSELGTYVVNASKDGKSASQSVLVDIAGTYTVSLTYECVIGVCWNYGVSSTTLSRLTIENDPNEYVNTNILTEPSPAVGTSSGSSPFDTISPWKDMDEYNIINGEVSYRKGDSGFSRSSYDTTVYIPEFYFKVVDDSVNRKRYFYISSGAKADFSIHPGSNKYLGRYKTISGYYSKSGSAPLGGESRTTLRTNAKSKNSKWGIYDFATWCAVGLLYLVEFADWNCQSKIGRGIADASAISNNGGTDSMIYHTGRASGTDGLTAVQYRHIENAWGNAREFLDGVNIYGNTVYLCTNPSNYADATSTNYTNPGVTLSRTTGYISSFGVSSTQPWAFLVTGASGSETTYIADYYSPRTDTYWRVLASSCYFGAGSQCGLFYNTWYFGAQDEVSSLGSRLLYHPQ